MRTVLSIAGFDPSSGAGVTADLKVFAAHGLFGTACITALTVQSTLGVREVHPIAGRTVAKTLRCLAEDLPPTGVKIGMLATSDNVKAARDWLSTVRSRSASSPVVVLDPVIRSTSGARLLDEAGVELLVGGLLGQVDWVTPNCDELELLTGRAVNREVIEEACHALQDMSGAKGLGVFAKGGHLERPDDYLLTSEGRGTWLPGGRVETSSTHGTGCALSSAFLSRLVLGVGPEEGARMAKEYVREALRRAEPMGQGYGPMNHLWPITHVGDAN